MDAVTALTYQEVESHRGIASFKLVESAHRRGHDRKKKKNDQSMASKRLTTP